MGDKKSSPEAMAEIYPTVLEKLLQRVLSAILLSQRFTHSAVTLQFEIGFHKSSPESERLLGSFDCKVYDIGTAMQLCHRMPMI